MLSVFISCLIYPVVGHAAWASLFHGDQKGWLEAMGFIDFAGSTVVHSVGGWVALAAVIVIGPRMGKFSEDGTPRRIQPHNMVLTYLGTLILFFGWFGFNAGSNLTPDPAIGPIIINTVIAACFGCIGSSALSWWLSPLKRPEPEMIANGLLGGLVGITAGCASVGTVGAACIGLIAGNVVYFATKFVEEDLRLDDVVGAIAVHGFAGAWGTLAVGLFITPENLGETSRWIQLGVQALGVAACFVWTFGCAYLFLNTLNRITPIRVPPEDEEIGLNIAEHGASSSVLDLVHAMHQATTSGDFSETAKVEVEHGTEIGDLAQGFNHMVDAVRGSLDENKRQQAIAQTERSKALEALEQAEQAQQQIKDALGASKHQEQLAEQERERAVEALQTAEEERSRAQQTHYRLEQERNAAAETRERYMHAIETHLYSLVTESDDMSASIGDTVCRTEGMSDIVGDVSKKVAQVSESLAKVTNATRQASEISREGAARAATTQTAVNSLDQSTREIGEVVAVINSIASQTNLLALNATIEAARAGKAGRGFAVVATAVKELAKESSGATERIRAKIEGIQDHSETVMAAIRDLSDSLQTITEINRAVAISVEDVTATSSGVSQAAEQAHEVSRETADIAKKTGGVSEKVKASYDSMRNIFEESAGALQEA